MAGNATGTEQSTGTIQEAALAFEHFLEPPTEDNQEQKAPTSEEPEAEAESDADTSPEEQADEAEAAEEQSGDEEQEQQTENKLYTVRVDGKDEQVPESELIAGYQRHADYTRKTQAIAGERKQLAHEAEQVRTLRDEYATLLPKLREVLEAGEKEPDWEALRATDPVRAAVEKDRWEERQSKLAKIRGEEERIAAEREEEQQQLRNQILIAEQEALFKRPELQHWHDEAKAAADAKLIVATLRDAGFDGEELKIYDHRAMVIAWKAAQYDAAKRRRTATQQEIRQKVSATPVSKPGNGNQNAPSSIRKASERLAKTGSVKDAAALFEQFL